MLFYGMETSLKLYTLLYFNVLYVLIKIYGIWYDVLENNYNGVSCSHVKPSSSSYSLWTLKWQWLLTHLHVQFLVNTKTTSIILAQARRAVTVFLVTVMSFSMYRPTYQPTYLGPEKRKLIPREIDYYDHAAANRLLWSRCCYYV